MVSAGHVQPSPDRSDWNCDFRAALPRSVQLQFRPAGPDGAGSRRRRDAFSIRRRGKARGDDAKRLELLDVVEWRFEDDRVLPQHDRPVDGSDREPDANGNPAGAREAAAEGRSTNADSATEVAFCPIDRLRADCESCRA